MITNYRVQKKTAWEPTNQGLWNLINFSLNICFLKKLKKKKTKHEHKAERNDNDRQFCSNFRATFHEFKMLLIDRMENTSRHTIYSLSAVLTRRKCCCSCFTTIRSYYEFVCWCCLAIPLSTINFYNTELWWQHTEITITTFDEIRKKSFKNMKNYVKFEMQIVCFWKTSNENMEGREWTIERQHKKHMTWIGFRFFVHFFNAYSKVSQSAEN